MLDAINLPNMRPPKRKARRGHIHAGLQSTTDPCESVFFRGSEEEPQRELRIPPVAVLADDPAEVGVGRIAVRAVQVRMVEEVEHFRAELELCSPLQREVLEQRNVPLLIARVAQ